MPDLTTKIAIAIMLGIVNHLIARAGYRRWVAWRKPDGSRRPGFMVGEATAFFTREGRRLRTRDSNPASEALRRSALRWMRFSGAFGYLYLAALAWALLSLPQSR
jgi:hypothetical protein